MNAIADTDVVQEGWEVLVEKLGLRRATQFVVMLEQGKGDSVKEISDYWGEMTIDEINAQLMAWKAETR